MKCAAFFGERTKKRAQRSHAEVCVTKISGMSLRFKVPITAERGSSGISATRRAQMAPKSSESFCKGHKNIQERAANPPVSLYSPANQRC